MATPDARAEYEVSDSKTRLRMLTMVWLQAIENLRGRESVADFDEEEQETLALLIAPYVDELRAAR